MSSDKDSVKAEESKIEEESKNEDTRESKDESGDVLSDASVEKEKKKEPAKRDASRKKITKVKEEVSEEEDNESADEEEDGGNDSSEQKVPLLDQPLQLSGTRDRKKVERFTGQFPTEPKEAAVIDIPKGKGKQLGQIPLIDAMIKRHRTEQLKVIHRILFNRIGKPELMKANILKFNGFDFDKESERFERKQIYVGKLEFSSLKDICTMLDLEKKGKRKQIAERIVEFLVEPADSGKPAPKARPTRGSAMKANNKGYSESEAEEEVEKRPARSRHGKAKRTNLKNEDTDDEAVDSKKTKNSIQEDEEEPPIEEENPVISEEESDEPKSKKKRGGRQTSNAKKPTPKKTSAKKAPPKKSNKKSSTKKRKMENGSEEESSEDEPLVKKSKAPPTDDEIKTYVKEILEGANLEEITMKTVCKQVYAHYPEFDLAHKKDFIKATVKSLIST